MISQAQFELGQEQAEFEQQQEIFEGNALIDYFAESYESPLRLSDEIHKPTE